MPTIDRNNAVPYYLQVYEQIVQGIEDGTFLPGGKLPSIRECARELGVSNTTIELAYQRLASEGFVEARRGSGFTICEISSPRSVHGDLLSQELKIDRDLLVETDTAHGLFAKPRFDFSYDAVDLSVFPVTTWARISRQVFFDTGVDSACLYNDRQGLYELREQIAHYLRSEHGLQCIPEQVLVMPTTRDVVAEIVALFKPEDTVFTMEFPGYDEVSKRLLERGYSLKAFPTYPYPRADKVDEILSDTNILFVTPSCQFPTNAVMADELRLKILQWAKENDAYIIDDEYGWEFQSGVVRTPSLAAGEPSSNIITIGTFSNSFTPAVCLSYAVLPANLMLKWRAERRDSHPQVPWQTQAAMASFMREGHWRTHVRKIRTAMARKRELLIDSISRHMGDAVEVTQGPNSLYVLLDVKDGRSDDELIMLAKGANVRVYPTRRYWNNQPSKGWNKILVGYSGIDANDIDAGIWALAKAWGFK